MGRLLEIIDSMPISVPGRMRIDHSRYHRECLGMGRDTYKVLSEFIEDPLPGFTQIEEDGTDGTPYGKLQKKYTVHGRLVDLPPGDLSFLHRSSFPDNPNNLPRELLIELTKFL